MAEALLTGLVFTFIVLVGRNFVFGICKLKPLKKNFKIWKPKKTYPRKNYFFL